MNNYPNAPRIAVVVSTCDRTELLSQRCLPSIAKQTRTPDLLIVVDDSKYEHCRQANKRFVETLPFDPSQDDELPDKSNVVKDHPKVVYLENQRKTGLSGASNTALDYLAQQEQDTYVAFLDDDDSWDLSYLEKCGSAVLNRNLDMIAADFRRIELSRNNSIAMEAPQDLISKEFLITNPGIQGSNLFVRLDVLLAAGGFDEALQSTTDRDLIIRIIDLGSVTYERFPEILVNHYAEPNRQRLSNRGSPIKLESLSTFWLKYHGRMTEDEQQAYKERAKILFDWKYSHDYPNIKSLNSNPIALTAFSDPKLTKPIISEADTTKASPIVRSYQLYVGVISSDPTTLQPLLCGLASLRKSEASPTLSVVLLDNGCVANELKEVIENTRSLGLSVAIVNMGQQSRDASAGAFSDHYKVRPDTQVGIAQARTMLQKYLGVLMTEDEGSFAWVLDDDMRVDDRALQYLQWLPAFRDEGVDVLLGTYEGASPNPPLHGLRVQLVDLLHNLHWLQNLSPSETLPDRSDENALLRKRYSDYYYDLSRKHTAHLEVPHWIEPADSEETVAQAYTRLCNSALNILNGASLTRPLQSVMPINPLETATHSVNRGGTAFILNPVALTQTPNLTVKLHDNEARRSDMFWAMINRQCRNLTIKSVNFPIYHDQRLKETSALNVEKVNSELFGSALYAALADVFAQEPSNEFEFSTCDAKRTCDRFEKHYKRKYQSLQINIRRIVGLSQAIRQLVEQGPAIELCDQLDSWFKTGRKQSEIACVELPERHNVLEFLSSLRTNMNDYASSSVVDINFIRKQLTAQKPIGNILDNWCLLPTPMGNFRMYDTENEHIRVVCMGELENQGSEPLLRVHSSCIASEVFGALDCDCAGQLKEAMKLMATEGRGMIIHLHQEGRGHGLSQKIRAVGRMQQHDLDTAESFESLGLAQDTRRYDAAVSLLNKLKITRVRLITNNPRKVDYLSSHGIRVEKVNTHPTERPENIDYLWTKKNKLGHELKLEELATDSSPILFYHSDQPWGELSNFSAHSIYSDERVWPTVEHYYQAKKFSGTPIEEEIRCCSTPMLAKIRAGEHQDKIREKWVDERESVMVEGLRAKFTQHPELQKRLLSSGERQLVEHTRNDAYWGDGGDGSGVNRLGILLMQVRTAVRQHSDNLYG